MGAPERGFKRRRGEEDPSKESSLVPSSSNESFTNPGASGTASCTSRPVTTPGDGQELLVKKSRGITEITVMRASVFKNVKQIVLNENYESLPIDTPTFSSIEAPPSILPRVKYCEITGFPAKYTDPRTKMHFCSPEAFRLARSLPDHAVQKFLALRQADLRLK
mmetsp:Transcript_3548/g.6720  ORF Transcript_3548/g.6720 Transcript_3548/m.6720 type:complete len:164 (-) Transcript_3548:45-536(-)